MASDNSETTGGKRIVLNPQQSEAVRTVEGPVLLLAVPGSGKTTVLVLRLGYMITKCGIAPENILTVTYTVAATRDMARRFAGYFGDELASRMEFRTINGICAKIIAYYSRAIGRRSFELVTEEKSTSGILTQIYQQVEKTWPTEADLRGVRTLITYIKNQMLTEKEIGELSSLKGGPLRASDSDINIAEIYVRYNRWLREQHLMDYDDQMVYALTILRKVPQVLAHFQEQYQYICVDEAQDTSKIQHTIIALLASGKDNLFMVGDEDQSIYGFRAAYPEALLNFEKEHRGAKILLMEENYRSGSGIVSASDRFIQKNTLRHAKHMVCAGRVGASDNLPVREVELRSRRSQYTYLLRVANDCKEETAVLYRNNESAIPLVDLLDRNQVPFRIRSAELSFFTHRTVMDLTNIIKLAYDPCDADAFWAVYYKLGLYLNKETASMICDLSRRLEMPVLETAIRHADLRPTTLRSINSMRMHLEYMKEDRGDQAISRIVRFMGYGEYLSGAGMKDSKIYILTTLGARTDSPAQLLDRLGELEEIFRAKSADPDCPFILSTIHASKGLEYDTVYLMDVIDGLFPETVPASMKYMQKEERRIFEEERRLFYVGMTRARKRLSVFTTGQKSVLADELFGREDAGPKASKPDSKRSQRKDPSTGRSGVKVRRAYEGTKAEVGRSGAKAGKAYAGTKAKAGRRSAKRRGAEEGTET